MKIIKASTEKDFKELNIFFWEMWKEEFNLELENQIDIYKRCDIYFIKEYEINISAIIYSTYEWKNNIWRFGTLEKYRWNWYGSKLLNYILNKYTWDFYLSSDINQVKYYEKFWFKNTWEKRKVWNTYWINMILEK